MKRSLLPESNVIVAIIVATLSACSLSSCANRHFNPAVCLLTGGETCLLPDDVRAKEDLGIDYTFGNDGAVIAGRSNLVMQPDGKIVVGDVQVQDKRCRQVLMRYSPEGTLDAYFGTGGKVIGDLEGYIFGEVAVLLQPDGRILIMGCDGISRYKQDGSLDQRFGVGGKVTLELGHESFGDRGLARAFAADREGNLVVLGYLYKFATAEKEIVLARYHSDGTPDTRFGTGGKAYLRVHSYNPPFAIAILPDGKLLVAGNILVRYHPDGSIDQSFGSGGLVILASYHSFTDAFALAVQPDGKILIASYLPGDKDTRTDYALVRFLSDGTLDTGFGRGGIVSNPSCHLEEVASIGVRTVTVVSPPTAQQPAQEPRWT